MMVIIIVIIIILFIEHLLPAFTAECFSRGLQMRKQIAERLSNLLKAAQGFEAGVAGG